MCGSNFAAVAKWPEEAAGGTDNLDLTHDKNARLVPAEWCKEGSEDLVLPRKCFPVASPGKQKPPSFGTPVSVLSAVGTPTISERKAGNLESPSEGGVAQPLCSCGQACEGGTGALLCMQCGGALYT